MTIAEKKAFYKFKNKVNLTNTETFGYFSTANPLNSELYVYLNTALDNSASNSITNYNIGYNIKDTIKLFWDSKTSYGDGNTSSGDVNAFYDESLFVSGQPILTEYMEYKGNIFELYERLTQYTKAKVIREQEVKTKYLDWFEHTFLTVAGLERISKYIFNPTTYTDSADASRTVKPGDLSYNFNEYFRIVASDIDIPVNKGMFAMAGSNSIRPSRIYYKKIKTEIGSGSYEYKFIFPLYLCSGLSVSTLAANTGLSVLSSVEATSVTQSTSY